jgi:2-C-methyl-D-erythritol 4-phosphate cytidylyltransferase
VKVWGLVAAAGSGVRMGEGGPKQFREVAGRPLFVHTLGALLEPGVIDGITVAVAEGFLARAQEIVSEHLATDVPIDCVAGGATRQESVYRGLVSIAGRGIDIVVIHDAARPLVSPETVRAAVDGAAAFGAAVAAVPAAEASCLAEGGFIAAYVDRTRHYTIQTPQAFRFDIIMAAHEKARSAGTTDAVDDGVLVRGMGEEVAVVAGSPENVKVTYIEDLNRITKYTEGRPVKK